MTGRISIVGIWKIFWKISNEQEIYREKKKKIKKIKNNNKNEYL